MNHSEQERRSFTRISFDRETTIQQNNHQWDVELIDLSLNGLLIAEPSNWHGDSNNKFTASIALDDNTTITMTVVMKHVEHGHIGFQCQHIDIDSISHLRRLVELNIGDLSLLERELAALGR